MSSSIKSQSRYKISFHVSLSSSFSTCLFQSMTVFSISYRDATKRSASQTLTCNQTCIFRVENVCNAYLHYEQTLSNATHHISIVNLLQERVNFAVTYRNRAHFLRLTYVYLTRTPAHIPTISIPTDHWLILSFTDYFLWRLPTPWKLIITAPQAATTALLVAGVTLWHAVGGSF